MMEYFWALVDNINEEACELWHEANDEMEVEG
jgi:hypothetical protein